jgi:predicted transglutaminase-like cysteine proteinase
MGRRRGPNQGREPGTGALP